MSFLEWTGNPFVDSGIAALLEHSKKRQPVEITREDLSSIASLLQEVYVTDKWKKNMYSIFLNYPLNQPSYKTEEKKREKLKEFLNDLLEGVEPAGERGDCIACGRRNTRKRKNRQHIPMTGSGGALNYFSFTSDGADYCDTCAYAVQCSPLTYYACGRLAMLHSNSPKVMRFWSKRAYGNVQEQRAKGDYSGCFNEGYTNPQNALFHITQDLILKYDRNWSRENATVRLYHFTNYIQGPELDIYDLPAPVFRFLAEVQAHQRNKDWHGIVRRGYYFVKNGKEIEFSTAGKTESDYKNSKNRVYRNLIDGKSILPRFLNRRTKRAYGDYSLLGVYLREVLAMDENRVETIRRVSDEIAAYVKDSPNWKKRLRGLEESHFNRFCSTLRHIILERIKSGALKPLFTYEEFVTDLFPEGVRSFHETRYLILFRVYEQLHDWLVEQKLVIDEGDDEADSDADEEPALQDQPA
jgi:CRISPR-associated protein Cst1